MTDAELLERARSDPAAFRALYDRYATRVHAYHLRRTRDQDAAHDLTAETFARAWMHRARFRDEACGSAGPWLFGIARVLVLVSVRERALERRACDALGVLEQARRGAAAGAGPAPEWLDGLDEAVADLPQTQRDAIALRILGDLGYDEVAERLETTPEAARARVSRGLGTLRDQLRRPMETNR